MSLAGRKRTCYTSGLEGASEILVLASQKVKANVSINEKISILVPHNSDSNHG
jgi:hypothetical protein